MHINQLTLSSTAVSVTHPIPDTWLRPTGRNLPIVKVNPRQYPRLSECWFYLLEVRVGTMASSSSSKITRRIRFEIEPPALDLDALWAWCILPDELNLVFVVYLVWRAAYQSEDEIGSLLWYFLCSVHFQITRVNTLICMKQKHKSSRALALKLKISFNKWWKWRTTLDECIAWLSCFWFTRYMLGLLSCGKAWNWQMMLHLLNFILHWLGSNSLTLWFIS